MAETKKRSNAGRKPKYSAAKEMQAKIDDYFSVCELKEKPPTISGLALALNMSRQGLCEYAGKNEFSDTIKKAKQMVEVHLEERLHESAPTGAIFNLKNNFGWKDKTEQEVSGRVAVERIERVIVDPKK